MRTTLILITFALLSSLAGCAHFSGPLGLGTASPGSIVQNQTRPGYDTVRNDVQLRSENGFTFVAAVSAESKSASYFGAVSTGEGGFRKLYDAAKEKGGDDVINIRTDVEYYSVLGIYLSARVTWYGIAIKYNRPDE